MNMRKTVRRILLPLFLMIPLILPVHASECPHEWVEHRIEPTCAGNGMVWSECLLCGDTSGYDVLDKLAHIFSDWYVLTEPECNQEGVLARDCVNCGFQETVPIPHVGHAYIVEVMPPTCTARGYTQHYCPGCGDRFRTDYTSPLGHRYDDGVTILEPTLETMGRIRYTCMGCGDTYQEYIPRYTNPFVDIDENGFYFIPVLWAVNNGITSGVDETHFDPGGVCNRAQVVTFLWSSAGKPEPDSSVNPFVDVPRGSFCEKAVLWAYEKGITTGTDATHFSPAAPCSRAHVVTFLYQYRGRPEPTVTAAFPDVRPTDFYYKAVLWAAQRGITAGMDGGNFRPASVCNRAQIVTFLYKDAKKP